MNARSRTEAMGSLGSGLAGRGSLGRWSAVELPANLRATSDKSVRNSGRWRYSTSGSLTGRTRPSRDFEPRLPVCRIEVAREVAHTPTVGEADGCSTSAVVCKRTVRMVRRRKAHRSRSASSASLYLPPLSAIQAAPNSITFSRGCRIRDVLYQGNSERSKIHELSFAQR
jgi:hypothetical protein